MAVNKKKAGSASFLDKQTYLRVNTYDGGKKNLFNSRPWEHKK